MAKDVGTKGVARADREQSILDAAVAEFGAQGYAHVSMDRIAARAGISKPLIYNYFGTKDGLYIACAHRAGAAIVEQVAAAQRGPHRGRAVASLQALFRVLEPRPLDWALLFDRTLPPTTDPYEAALLYRRKLAELGNAGVREALSEIGNHDDRDVSLVTQIWFSVVSATVGWWLEHPEESAESISQRSARILAAVAGGT
ncbi:TetR/AcrR family transcriptional regulator [Mycobacterium sp. Y57]|uniref:TetR/AcrR family transcriptional regulator n=1 Tax=Mycolicibacterium xanthum TaxID=2796469 RepID=UPI001C85EE5A|nr:TetR/AcrR family transcriptional regulator [Mycolicibacterium xanthum]MBX7435119.1 TetR/AcrR family transcriptional regulator [Mycolicibacterium xanthum]